MRVDQPNLSFVEMNKQLGGEWTALAAHEKQVREWGCGRFLNSIDSGEETVATHKKQVSGELFKQVRGLCFRGRGRFLNRLEDCV